MGRLDNVVVPGRPGLLALIASSLLVLLAGCANVQPTAPVPPTAFDLSLTSTPVGFLQLSWDDADGETEYRLLTDPDGSSGFSLHAVLPADTTGYEYATYLPAATGVRFKVQACNESGCIDSNEAVVDAGLLVQAIGYFKASNAEANDVFGSTLALSADGRTLAVGAPLEASAASGVGGDQADNSAPQAGAVYVFVRDAGGNWSQQAYLKASNPNDYDRFGSTLALSADGRTLAVGAPLEASAASGVGGDQADNSAPQAGAVYVFVRDAGGNWSQQAYLKAPNQEAGDGFGSALALSGDGNILAVGAYGEDSAATGVGGDQADNSAPNSGAAYVFVRSGGATWTPKAYLKASNTGAADAFGSTLALSRDGSTLAVGAPKEASAASGVGGDQADDSALEAGAVYVFVQNALGEWIQQAYVKAPNAEAGDLFGSALALSSNGAVLVSGAYWEDSGTTDIDGDASDNSAPRAGAVYVFARSEIGAWAPEAYIKAPNAEAADFFGFSLSLSDTGDALAVGAYGENSAASGLGGDWNDNSAAEAGAVYTFTRNGNSSWAFQAYLKATNPDAGDRLGFSLSLSGDGATLAAAAIWEDGAATGLGGDATDNTASNAGAVQVY